MERINPAPPAADTPATRINSARLAVWLTVIILRMRYLTVLTVTKQRSEIAS